MDLKNFREKYKKAAKLEKIKFLAKNLEWLIKQHEDEVTVKAEECLRIYSEYLEFGSKPDLEIVTAVTHCRIALLRILSRITDLEKIDAAIEELQEFVLQQNNSVLLAELYSKLCFIMLNKREYPRAAEYGEKAFKLIGNKQLTPYMRAFYSNYGMALIYTRQFDRAKEILALGLAKNPNKFISEKLHMHLGLLYRNMKDYQSAISEFLIAKDLHEADDVSGTVILNINIASIYAIIGDYKKVISYLKSNFELANEHELDDSARSNYIASFSTFVSCAVSIQDFDNASQGLKLMKKAIKKFNLPDFLNDFYRLSADLACGQGDFEQAEEIYQQAYNLQKKNVTAEIFFLQAYVNFLLFVQKYEKALNICDDGIKLIDPVKNSSIYLSIMKEKIAALKGLNRFEEALSHLEGIYKKENEVNKNELKQQVDQLLEDNQKKEKQLREKEKRISLFHTNFMQEHNINFVGTSSAIRDVIEKASIAAQHPEINVLIFGESGTGKELIAKYIHFASQADKTVFQEVNCSAIPDTMLESEFFGYKKGAFTGAVNDMKGFIEASDNGTLFLDEIGDLPSALQPKLLKVLEEKKFTPLGSNKSIQVSFRLISATNRDLVQMIKDKEFRADLFNRINSLIIEIPPLRQRPADIIPLTDFFLQNFTREFNMIKPEIDAATQEVLLSYSYPGNVRELRNIIERTMIFVRQGESFGEALLRHGFFFTNEPVESDNKTEDYLFVSNTLHIDEVEKNAVLQALEMTGNRKSRAASILGITPSSLTRRLQKFKIDL